MMWIICGAISALSCILGWIWTAKGEAKAMWAVVCSLAFVALTVLSEYRVVANWVEWGDWGAIEDVVPSMLRILTGYVVGMLLANAVSVAAVIRRLH